MPTLRKAFSTSHLSARRVRIASVLLAASMLCGATTAQAAFYDGWFGTEADNLTDDQRAELGPKRVPERNAGDRTAGSSLLLEPASPQAAMQATPSAPVANNYAPSQYPAGQYPMGDAAPQAELYAPAPTAPVVEAYAPAPVAAPAPQMDAAAQVTDPMAGSFGIPAGYGNAPASAYGAASFDAPAANNTNGLAAVRATAPAPVAATAAKEKRPTSLLGFLGLSEEEQPAAPAPVAQNHYAAPAAQAPVEQHANAAAAPVQDGVEYYDANGYPILSATPANPPAPNHAANDAQIKEMQAMNQAGEGTRAAFMARGEDAFAPLPPSELPSANAPSAMDELALSGYPSQQPAPVAPPAPAPVPMPVAQAEPVYAPAPVPTPQPDVYMASAAQAPAPAPVPAYEAPSHAQYNGELLPPPQLPDANQQQAFAAAPAYNPPPAQAAAVQDFSGEIPLAAAPAPAPVPAYVAPAYAPAPAAAAEPVHVALTSNERAVPDYVPAATPVAAAPAAVQMQQPAVAAYNASPYGYAGPQSQAQVVPSQQATRYLPDSRYASRRQGNAHPGLLATN